MSWTCERVELLKKFWNDGLSASQIAAQLGGVSRNAVIGKVHRLKLPGRGKATQGVSRAQKVQAGSRVRETAPLAFLDNAKDCCSEEMHKDAEFTSEKMAKVDVSVNQNLVTPISRRLNLLQLSENTCRWPVGDPLLSDFHFCGADSGDAGPYCAFHSKIAFQPLSERRRMRV